MDAIVFFRKLDESLNRAWGLGVLSQERLDELRKVDVRKYSLEIKDFNNEKKSYAKRLRRGRSGNHT